MPQRSSKPINEVSYEVSIVSEYTVPGRQYLLTLTEVWYAEVTLLDRFIAYKSDYRLPDSGLHFNVIGNIYKPRVGGELRWLKENAYSKGVLP